MGLKNAFGDLSLESTQQEVKDLLEEIRDKPSDSGGVEARLDVLIATQQTNTLTNNELRSVPVDVNVVNPSSSSNVAVTNLPPSYPLPASQVIALTPKQDGLTDAEIRATPLNVNVVNSSGSNVEVDNFPTEYPLPASQITTLSPQVDGLTDAQLRASPVGISVTTLPLPAGAAVESKQLPDNHNVTVSNQITDYLTDDELRAAPIDVVVTNQITVDDVSVNNFPATYPLPSTQITALTPQTDGLTDAQLRATAVPVSGTVAVSNTTFALPPAQVTTLTPQIDALTDDELRATPVRVEVVNSVVTDEVEVTNFPATYPLPAAQLTTLTPQTNALTNAELRATAVSVSGTVNVANMVSNLGVNNFPSEYPLPATQVTALSNGLTNTQLRATPVDVKQIGGTTGTVSNVAASTSSGSILAANANRKGATIYNNSTDNRLYITLGAGASTTNFTMIIESRGYYEVPNWYLGQITGVCDNTTGNIKVTEIV